MLRPRFLTAAQYRFLHDTREGAAARVPGRLRPRHRPTPSSASSSASRDWERRTARRRPRATATRARPAGSTRSSSPTTSCCSPSSTPRRRPGPGTRTRSPNCSTACRCSRSSSGASSVFPIPARPGVLHALTDSFNQWQGNTLRPAADRHPRLARGADVQRVRPLLRLLQGDGHRGPHRRSARLRVPRRQAHGRRLPHHADLQARAHQRS